MTDNSPTTPLLTLTGVGKSYGPVRALDNVTFSVRDAQILGLLGDNGAGKSTLIKIMSGVAAPDEGTITWAGQETLLKSRSDSASLGIETIFQDSALVDSMSVARNIFMGREPANRFGFMRHREMTEVSSDILSGIVGIRGVDSPEKPVGELSGGQKQAVAIARARPLSTETPLARRTDECPRRPGY